MTRSNDRPPGPDKPGWTMVRGGSDQGTPTELLGIVLVAAMEHHAAHVTQRLTDHIRRHALMPDQLGALDIRVVVRLNDTPVSDIWTHTAMIIHSAQEGTARHEPMD